MLEIEADIYYSWTECNTPRTIPEVLNVNVRLIEPELGWACGW